MCPSGPQAMPSKGEFRVPGFAFRVRGRLAFTLPSSSHFVGRRIAGADASAPRKS
jgi:hypothetical protein